jgi:hypothetical protein
LKPTFRRQQNLQSISYPPLDNYYQRPHIRKTSVPLVVGGSDGSGTRAFVQALQDLGVTMVIEDEGTMDVHGGQLFGGEGWPGLVSRVLNVTHSAVYDVRQLPEGLQAVAYTDLGNMLSNMQVAADVMRQVKREKAKAAATASEIILAEAAAAAADSDISFGFKAPVTMLLLPFFRHRIPAFKFLHVVRDGRDVAFSDNHSPVDKFYQRYFEDALARDRAMLHQDFGFHTRNRIKAMQLWNDWNKQIYEYELSATDGRTLDVLVMRSEDLLYHKYESLLKIADFVGSSLSPPEICCLSQKSIKDIGKVVISSTPQKDEPLMSGASDYEKIGDRFHALGSNIHGDLSLHDNYLQQPWAITGRWTDIRQKMLDQHQIDNNNDDQGRKLLETSNRPSEDWGKVVMNDALRYFSNRISKRNNHKFDQVKDRYGKWKQKLVNSPELRERLLTEGRDALRIFGYEPLRPFMDFPIDAMPPICDESVPCPQI